MSQFIGQISLQEQLRPLFCTQEINIESDASLNPTDRIQIPSGFWLNPLLGRINISLDRSQYQQLLTTNRMQFPETQLKDADHAWLTPVKGQSDLRAIKKLVNGGVIYKQFVQSVLMIDFKHPVCSKSRCELLNLLPSTSTTNWQKRFINNLQRSPKLEAQALANYLSDSQLSFAKTIRRYKATLHLNLSKQKYQERAFKHLIALRQAVYKEEMSKNPLGQILEPGFRGIFPIPNHD